MDIGKIIADLLYHYDTITIPGFGGLVLQQYSAESDQVLGNIQPPSKRLSFNPNLVLDDGLLLSQIRNQLQLPADAAKNVLQNYVSDLNGRLKAGESVAIEGIGHFFQSGDQVQFAAATVNYDRNSYGLPNVKADVSSKIGADKIVFETTETATAEVTAAESRDYGRTLKWFIPLLGVLALAIILLSLIHI